MAQKKDVQLDLKTYLAKARGGTTKNYRNKTTVFSQGSPADAVFYIEKGKVKVVVELDNGRTMRVRSMGAGTVVGEIGLYLDQQRLASVVTEEPCTMYRLSGEALIKMEQENPALAAAFHEFMVRVLAERVTQQNRTLRALVE